MVAEQRLRNILFGVGERGLLSSVSSAFGAAATGVTTTAAAVNTASAAGRTLP